MDDGAEAADRVNRHVFAEVERYETARTMLSTSVSIYLQCGIVRARRYACAIESTPARAVFADRDSFDVVAQGS